MRARPLLCPLASRVAVIIPSNPRAPPLVHATQRGSSPARSAVGGRLFSSGTGQKMSACCHLHSGGSWCSLPASLRGAVLTEEPGSAPACVRGGVRACVCVPACVWVGRAERSHSTVEREVHTSQPRGKMLHMKVQKNRSYLYFKTVDANSKPIFFPCLMLQC